MDELDQPHGWETNPEKKALMILVTKQGLPRDVEHIVGRL